MQITEQIIERIARKTFNSMFAPALRQSNVVTSGAGSSVNWADNAGHANSADSLTDLSQIENMLANYVTTSALSTTLADYVTVSALQTTLADYATKTYVDQNYLSLSFFNALFQARTSQGAVVAPNSGDTTTIDNIKAMFGFWTDQYISALGQGSDGGGATTTLAQLNDVQLSLPLADGEALVYSSTLGKWTNSAAIAPAWSNITGKPTTIAGYGITDAHITNGVITLGANSITPITSLTGYATETWVSQNYVSGTDLATTLADYVTTTALGTTLADYVTTTALGTTLADYATKTYVDQNYLSLAFFNALFQARTSGGVAVAPNSGDTTTIDNIKALFGFWTDQYISALGQGSDGGSVTSLAALADVSLSTPIADGEVLKYSTTLGKWTNGTASMVGALNDLTDVTISSLADKDILQYDYATTQWKNVNLTTALSGYATTSQLANYLPVSGGTLSGNLLVSTDKGASIGSASARFYYNYLYRILGLASISASTDGTNVLTLPAKSGTLAVVGDIPTNNNQLTNGAGYITGITSSMVTTALGYTPANSSSLSSYLPLSGGTMSGSIISDQTYLIKNSNTKKYLAQSSSGLFLTNLESDQYLTLESPHSIKHLRGSSSYLIWDEYNDGSGSGLDADLLDGQHGSYYAAASSLSNYLPLSGGTMTGTIQGNGIYFRSNGSNGYTEGITIYNSSNSNYAVFCMRGYNTNHLLALCYEGINHNTAYFVYDDGTNSQYIYIPKMAGTLALTSQIPTSVSSLTNDAGYITNSIANTNFTLTTEFTGSGIYPSNNYILIKTTNGASTWEAARIGIYIAANAGGVGGYPAGLAFYTKSGDGSANTAATIKMVLDANGCLGIGNSSPAYKLHVTGDVYATGGVTALSDIRKKDVIDYKLPLSVEQIAQAPTIRFTWKDCREKGEQVGTIAQYWQDVLPQVIKDKSNELSMQYGVAALISAITTARAVVNHEERISALERECKEWKDAYHSLKMDYEQLKLKIA